MVTCPLCNGEGARRRRIKGRRRTYVDYTYCDCAAGARRRAADKREEQAERRGRHKARLDRLQRELDRLNNKRQ